MYNQEKYMVNDFQDGLNTADMCHASGICYEGVWKAPIGDSDDNDNELELEDNGVAASPLSEGSGDSLT